LTLTNVTGGENENISAISPQSEQINELLNHKFIHLIYILLDISSGIFGDSLVWNLILLSCTECSNGALP
jgi:hypothetical protein